MDIYEESVKAHETNRGKLEINVNIPLATKQDLSIAYTPGVAEPCRQIAKDQNRVYDLTIKRNSLAVITDGSRVLSLGNIGPYAALPVMEGKAAIFKRFAGIDAFPICVRSQKVDDIVRTCELIEPVFGAINLEDIEVPKCFEVEERLQNLGIPVMHDDQHGTACAAAAALYNAVKLVGKDLSSLLVVINGAGAAGVAIGKMLYGSVRDVIFCDRNGTIYYGKEGLKQYKIPLSRWSNRYLIRGTLADALRGSDVFIGVSEKGALNAELIKGMANDPIIFALANPEPEILPDEAKAAGAAIVATGRSDFANQVNNALVFPGIFRGALDARATIITQQMKRAAAKALADYVKNPSADEIIPSPLDALVHKTVAKAVESAYQKY